MTRPYVQIKSTNELHALRGHLDAMLPRFTSFEGVVGLTLNGGMSRGYADRLSEVNVTFFLDPDAFQQWQRSKTPIALGITVLEGQLYDIKIVDYAAERERVWDPVTLWDASYAEILYDPDGRLHDLYVEKLADQPDIDDYVRATYAPQLPVRMMQRSFYEHLHLLVQAGSLSIEEWESQTGDGIPNYDPFHPITKLEQGRIVVDYEALLGIGPEAMYSWHDEVLEAVAAQVRSRQT